MGRGLEVRASRKSTRGCGVTTREQLPIAPQKQQEFSANSFLETVPHKTCEAARYIFTLKKRLRLLSACLRLICRTA